VLTGHTGSVLCLQFAENIIMSGSSDHTVRVWNIDTGVTINTLVHHRDSVLYLKYGNSMLITCSKVSIILLVLKYYLIFLFF